MTRPIDHINEVHSSKCIMFAVRFDHTRIFCMLMDCIGALSSFLRRAGVQHVLAT